jgi:hypothetical protein
VCRKIAVVGVVQRCDIIETTAGVMVVDETTVQGPTIVQAHRVAAEAADMSTAEVSDTETSADATKVSTTETSIKMDTADATDVATEAATHMAAAEAATTTRKGGTAIRRYPDHQSGGDCENLSAHLSSPIERTEWLRGGD